MKYYIIAGEPSGDLHGSNLIKGLRTTDPSAAFRFWGGDMMQNAAGEQGTLVRHYREESVMGFWEVAKNLRRINRSMNFCKADILDYAPDALILIDYAGFNLRMAKFAKAHGIKVLYYIAPKVWAWKESRVKKIKKYVDHLYVIFPFEVDYFGKFGIDAFYAGNPLMDSLLTDDNEPFDAFCAANNLNGKPIVALVPGSRRSEILHNLPVMVAVAAQMDDYQFVVTGVDWLDAKIYNDIIGATQNVKLVINKTRQTLYQCTSALVTSGTATLETALLGVPQVVCYIGNGLTIWIAKKLVKIKWISLVNIVMQKTVVTELIQEQCTPASALRELKAILPDGERSGSITEDYRILKDKIGGPGASDRAAKQMYKTLLG